MSRRLAICNTNTQVILTTGCNKWDEGLDVVVEGNAVRVTDDTLLQRLAAAWATKWDGRWRYEARNGYLSDPGGGTGSESGVMVFAVAPSKVLAFGKGTFTQTRHRF